VTVVGDRGQEFDHASILSVVGQILWEALAKSIATSSQLFEILKSFILDVLVLLGRICEFAPDANDWKIWGLVKPISTIWLFVIRPTPRLREPSQSYDKMSYIIRLWGDQLSISIYIIYLTISCKNFYTYIYLYIYTYTYTHTYIFKKYIQLYQQHPVFLLRFYGLASKTQRSTRPQRFNELQSCREIPHSSGHGWRTCWG
jgi:hypothetical protein